MFSLPKNYMGYYLLNMSFVLVGPGDPNDTRLFLTVLDAGKSEIKVSVDLGFGEDLHTGS